MFYKCLSALVAALIATTSYAGDGEDFPFRCKSDDDLGRILELTVRPDAQSHTGFKAKLTAELEHEPPEEIPVRIFKLDEGLFKLHGFWKGEYTVGGVAARLDFELGNSAAKVGDWQRGERHGSVRTHGPHHPPMRRHHMRHRMRMLPWEPMVCHRLIPER